MSYDERKPVNARHRWICRMAVASWLIAANVAVAGDPWRGFWVWDNPKANVEAQPAEARFFRKVFELPSGVTQSHVLVMADNSFEMFVNGTRVGEGSAWWPPVELDVTEQLVKGTNVIAIRASNAGGEAGLFVECNLKSRRGKLINVITDESWRTSAKSAENWTAVGFDDSSWSAVSVLGEMGIKPWGIRGKPGGSNMPAPKERLPAVEALKHFQVPDGFEVQLIAEEPDVINPVAMAMDEQGRLYVTESHTYRWGEQKSPMSPATNPVVLLEFDDEGRARRKTIVDQGFKDPIMGIAVREGRIWMAELNKLYVADLQPDGTAGERRIIMHDVDTPWNPFGMFQLSFGPDGWMYMIVGNHQIEMIGSDGMTAKTRGSTGAMFRFREDGTGLQMLSQGMRAPFSFDFDPYGHLWMLSNGEGNPNRLIMNLPTVDYHFQTRHGPWSWLAGDDEWSPPVTEMERGANTQVVCYLDKAFPEEYWGSLFVANWGAHGYPSVNHKIDLYVPDERGVIESVSVFLNSTDPMFRPTQLWPAPDGNLYILDWYGKDDENDMTGRIYKVVYTGDSPKADIVKRTFDVGADLSADGVKALLGLQSNDRYQRDAALRWIELNGNDAVVEAALQILRNDQEPFISAQMLWALYRIADRSRGTADSEVGRYGGRGADAAVDAISEAVQTKHPLIRAMVVRLLRDLDPPNLLERIAFLEEDYDPETRVEVALCHDDPQAVVERLFGALRAGAVKDRRLRYQCAVELSRRMTAAQWVALASDDDPLMQMTAWIGFDVQFLEEINPAARPAFHELLANPPAGAIDALLSLSTISVRADTAGPLRTLIAENDLSPQQLVTAMDVLRRVGGDEGVTASASVVQRFLKDVREGKVKLERPQDRIGALQLVESIDWNGDAVHLVEQCLRDGNGQVRTRALGLMRLYGWQAPTLYGKVWEVVSMAERPLEERIDAIAAVAMQDPPHVDGWKALLAADEVAIVRMTLRTMKQLAGNDEVKAMLLAVGGQLVKQDESLKPELTSVLTLFGVDDAERTSMGLTPSLSTVDRSQIMADALGKLPTGHTELGRIAFDQLGCSSCHNVTGQKASFGPALKDIGKAVAVNYIIESVLFPSKVIKDGFDLERVTLADGSTEDGIVETHGDDYVIVRAVNDEIRVPRIEVTSRDKLSQSPMPDLVLDGVSIGELTDLLAYLVSQGGDPKAAHAAAGSN